MTQTPSLDQEHPLSVLVARVHEELDEAAGLPVWSLGQAGTAATLSSLTRLAARVASLELRVAAQAREVAVEELTGATSTATWWAHRTRLTRAETHRKLRLADGLKVHEPVAAKLTAGEVLADQAGVIIDALTALPDHVDAAVKKQAETQLLHLAKGFDARALRRLGKGILAVVAPEVGEAHEAAVLEKEERDAAAAARFTMTDDGHGKAHGRFTLSTLHAAMLRKALLAYAAPKHRAATGHPADAEVPGAERMSAEKQSQAFTELIEHLDGDTLPNAGGVAATVVVTTTLDAVRGGGQEPATLDTGERLSVSAVRRLACQAGIVPVVLGGQGQVLDLGRQRRFHTRAQRIALGLRDGGCTAQGCDWPPGLCHAHHDTPWQHGGPTDLEHARLLCPRHHARAHDPTYETVKLSGGKVAFTRRT